MKLREYMDEAERLNEEYQVLRTARIDYYEKIDTVNEKTDVCYLHLVRLEAQAADRYHHFIERNIKDLDMATDIAYHE